MSLEQIYTRFLAAPRRDALADSASIHYITTAVSLSGPDKIVAQLAKEQHDKGTQLKKRVEKPLATVQTGNSLVIEMDTEIEFLTSGANWLPGLDDNFLADHIVRFPVVHIVNFEGTLIKEVRLYWDQANILKQINIIGRTGRNWPIRDGADQIKMIGESVKKQSTTVADSSNGNAPVERSRSSSKDSTSTTRDPSAQTLHLFNPADQQDAPEKPLRPPRSSSAFRPPTRDLEDIIGESNEAPQPVAPPKMRGSFSKGQTFDLASHASKDHEVPAATVEKTPNAKKYKHFEFGNGEDAKPDSSPRPTPVTGKSRNESSWDFEDFNTPEKRPIHVRKDDVRHFGFGDEQPAPLSNVTNALRDARIANNSHFEISDSSPAGPVSAAQRKLDRPGKQQKARSAEPEDDDDDFFAQFGAEKQHTTIAIAGDGRGQNAAVKKDWSWDMDQRKV
ncbi:hypothetical protein BZA77DRAFT_242186 [Pyronema omphalodes]|nr:hypothetical protein BZA77DRAFT_242186 [Pyronema omphalodes]